MIIRPEEEKDHREVYELNERAFGGSDEANLVEKLREARIYHSLVAAIDEKVVGHIAFSALTLNDEDTKFVGLAPMSVLPDFQNQSIGSRLVTKGLERMASEGCTAVFVLGHANYYPRFGFRTAADLGFTCKYPSPPENFMALELVENSLTGRSGLIKYDPAFAAFA